MITDLLPRTLSSSTYKARVLRTLTRRQHNRCYLCHRQMDDPRRVRWPTPRYPTLDHVFAQSLGGDDEWDNLRLACYQCNCSKGNRLPADLVWRPRAGDGLRGGLGARS